MGRIVLRGALSYIDKYERAIFCLDDESAAKVLAVNRDATPSALPVRSRIPPNEFVGKWCRLVVTWRKYSFTSTSGATAGTVVSGISFRLEKLENDQ